MEYSKIRSFVNKNGIKLSGSWFAHYNCVRYHNKGESANHWETKCKITGELLRKGQSVFSEFAFDYSKLHGPTKRMRFPTADLFWADELIVIEIESKLTEKTRLLKQEQYKDFNLFIFDLSGTETLEEFYERCGIW